MDLFFVSHFMNSVHVWHAGVWYVESLTAEYMEQSKNTVLNAGFLCWIGWYTEGDILYSWTRDM